MGWSNEEEVTTKKRMELSTKILLGIIVCVIFIIILISVLLLNIQQTTYKISVDGQPVNKTNKDKLLATIADVTYVNIKEFSGLVKYEYHEGEYKSFVKEEDKCYVKGANETATFYLNDNKICKLPVDKLTDSYKVYTTENIVKTINGGMYATVDAIEIAFNVKITTNANSLTIYTLDSLVTTYDTKLVKEWGYSSISEQDFENKKAILYDHIIVKKDGGLYKIIKTDNTEEIVPDKYSSIEFIEETKEFFVTNSLGQVGIINLDGTTKIEPVYDSIEVLDKKSDLYLIEKNKKYGVVKSGGITVIHPEYDMIGLDTEDYDMLDSKYLLLDTLIPVSKEGKYGAFDKKGNIVYKVEYDGIGCPVTEVEINEVTKTVNPVVTIEECQGVVLEKEEKYGVRDIQGEDLVPIAVDSIYSVENEEKEIEYFMFYKNEELNVIERLIKAGLIKQEEVEKEEIEENEEVNNIVTVDVTGEKNNTVNNTVGNTTTNTNTVSNKVTNTKK